MPEIKILKGLPGSGKTTLAKQIIKEKTDWVRVNKDDIRRSNFGDGKVPEKRVIQLQNAMIDFFMSKGLNIVVDDTNLNPYHERRINDIVARFNSQSKEIQYAVSVTVMDTPIEECVLRDSLRTGTERVGSSVIYGMRDKYFPETLSQSRNELAKVYDAGKVYAVNQDNGSTSITIPNVTGFDKVIVNGGLETVVLCDIDGTIALMRGRSPFDMSKVSQDRPNAPVLKLVKTLLESGTKVVFVSGRSDDAREDTERWLEDQTGVYPELYMRKFKDNRKDSIVKEEIYRNEILNKYNVWFILDDRNQVVEMWRSLGLTCLQVAEGNF